MPRIVLVQVKRQRRRSKFYKYFSFVIL